MHEAIQSFQFKIIHYCYLGYGCSLCSSRLPNWSREICFRLFQFQLKQSYNCCILYDNYVTLSHTTFCTAFKTESLFILVFCFSFALRQKKRFWAEKSNHVFDFPFQWIIIALTDLKIVDLMFLINCPRLCAVIKSPLILL